MTVYNFTLPQKATFWVCFSSMLLIGCSSTEEGGEGRFVLDWTLQGSSGATTCAGHDIASVVVTTTNPESGGTHSLAVPCIEGGLTTMDLAHGTYEIELEAMGSQGELAGAATVSETLDFTGDVELDSVPITVESPTSSFRPLWSVRSAGEPSDCAAFSSAGVSVITQIPTVESPQRDIYYCEDLNVDPIPIPLGPFSAFAELLGPNDELVVRSAEVDFPTTRGLIEHEFVLDVP